MNALAYLVAALFLVSALVLTASYRRSHPWRSVLPKTNDERYLDWVNRHAEFEKRQRLKKARQRMRVLRRLDDRYAKRATVHTP